MSVSDREPTSALTWTLIAGLGPVGGSLAGIAYSLAHTVPQWILSPSSTGGTGSAGLSIFGAIVGAAVGLGFGVVVSAVALTVFAVISSVTRRDRIRIRVSSAAAGCCAFVVFGSFAEWGDGRVVVESSAAALGCLATFALTISWSIRRTRRTARTRPDPGGARR